MQPYKESTLNKDIILFRIPGFHLCLPLCDNCDSEHYCVTGKQNWKAIPSVWCGW